MAHALYANRLTIVRAALLTGLAGLAACASTPPAPIPSPAAPLRLQQPLPDPDEQNFHSFITDFRAQALALGIEARTYDAALGTVHFNPRIIGHTTSQPEFIKPVWDYLDAAVNPRIAPGKARIAEFSPLLDTLETRYGVPKSILVSIWGNETDFGKVSGRYNLFSALASLAFRGPRATFARGQLISALQMVQKYGFAPEAMTASWAGAFGQTQFEPSSFMEHAVDGDGDGQIDLWHSSADALASAASLLAAYGWQRGEPWGYEITLPAGFAYETADLDRPRPVTEWQAQGVRKADGSILTGAGAGAIFLPAGAQGPAFLVLANFRAVMKYNAAAAYALAVCHLADRLEDRGEIQAAWPRNAPQLSHGQRVALQQALVSHGFAVGVIDGIIGNNTRVAIRQFQKQNGLIADGFATRELLDRLTGTPPSPATVSAN